MPEHLEQLTESLARDSSRRGFLARVGGALMAATAARTVGALVEPGDSDAFHFCGHIFTTGSCPHPAGLPRIVFFPSLSRKSAPFPRTMGVRPR